MADAISDPKGPPLRRSITRTVFLVASALLSLGVAAGAGLSIAGIHHFEAQIDKVDVGRGCVDPDCLRDIEPGPCIRDACNFLVLGSDTREGLTAEEQKQFGNPQNTEGQRADTIIVVQTDVKNDRTIVLSIPRDLRVAIPGFGVGKINTALEHGPNVIVQTVEDLTGLQINHYIEVNFVGFQELVNALGGVPVCIDRPLIDRLSGLNLPHAGCYNLKGPQALSFVRARHIEGDIIPDFSRISRQQQFTRAVINKVLSVGAVFHYPAIVRSVSDNLQMDSQLNLYALQDLTRELAQLGQKSVDFRVVPARPVDVDGVSYVDLAPNAAKLFERIRMGLPLGPIGREAPSTPISPANVSVQVLDADSGGKADEVASYLRRAGFVVAPLERAQSGLDATALFWGHGASKEVKVVASYLPTLPLPVFDPHHVEGRQITVVIGPDFTGIEGS